MTNLIEQGIHRKWEYREVEDEEYGKIVGDFEVTEGISRVYAERIVACVNFCRAFPTTLLEQMGSLQQTQTQNGSEVHRLEEELRYAKGLLYVILNGDMSSALESANEYLEGFVPEESDDEGGVI